MDNCSSITERKQSNTINYLRAIAIILVLTHHGMFYGKNYLLEVGEAYSDFMTIIGSVHVPLFFMISGYLCHAQNILKYYKKKTFQIIIPFLVFTSLKLSFNLFSDRFSHANTAGGEFLSAYVYGEYYWFSYSLFIMVLLAPLLWKLKNKFVLVGTFILLLSFNIINGFLHLISRGGPLQIFSVLIYGIWFLLGYVLKQLNVGNMLNNKLKKNTALLLSISASALVIFLSSKDILNAFLSKFILSLTLSYVLLYIFSSIKFKIPLLEHVSKYSYQIFLLDSFVKVALFAIASIFLTINIPVIILLIIFNIIISTVVSSVAHKIRYVKVLFGLS